MTGWQVYTSRSKALKTQIPDGQVFAHFVAGGDWNILDRSAQALTIASASVSRMVFVVAVRRSALCNTSCASSLNSSAGAWQGRMPILPQYVLAPQVRRSSNHHPSMSTRSPRQSITPICRSDLAFDLPLMKEREVEMRVTIYLPQIESSSKSRPLVVSLPAPV
jgi:hypothetical protein